MSGHKFIEFCDNTYDCRSYFLKLKIFFYNDRYKIRALSFLDVMILYIYN